MAKKIKLVKSGKLDKEGAKKIGKSFLITIGAAAIVFVGDLTTTVDFGGYQTYVATFMPFVVNFLRKWLGKYKSTE